MNEKRTQKRSPIELAASFGIPEDSIVTKVINVSKGGFCITTDIALKSGQIIDLAVDIDDSQQLSARVQVVWVSPIENSNEHRVGVQIVDVNSGDLEKILKLI